MISKKVDEHGTINMIDGEKHVMSLSTAFDRERGLLQVTIEGNLRTDVQPYLGTELQFYSAADIPQIEVDCSKITAVSAGCFGELLDLKIKMAGKNAVINFVNKPDCLTRTEKLMGKKL